jgi:hypothetical protein
VKAIILLADAASSEPATGKVNMLGAGWSITSTPLPAHAVVALLAVPWDQTNKRHLLRLSLLDADGKPVLAPSSSGSAPVPVSLEGKLEVGRPAGLPPGSEIDAPFVVQLPAGLPIGPGRYVWQLEVNHETQESWSASFLVREGSGTAAGGSRDHD